MHYCYRPIYGVDFMFNDILTGIGANICLFNSRYLTLFLTALDNINPAVNAFRTLVPTCALVVGPDPLLPVSSPSLFEQSISP